MGLLGSYAAHEVGGAVAGGSGDLDDAFGDVVVLEVQRARHDRVHLVERGDVGQLEDLLVAERGGEAREGRVLHAAVLKHELVYVGEHGAFARVEQVKKFHLLEAQLTAEDEELTPTMKLKRKLVQQKYAPQIEAMYH